MFTLIRRPKDQQKKEETRGTVYKIKCNDCTEEYTSARRHAPQKSEPKNMLKLPLVLTKTLNWPNIPKKLATASILKTCQFFTSVPTGTGSCFWKRGILVRKRTQSTSMLSFHACTSISRIAKTSFWHTLYVYFVTSLPTLTSLVIFAYVTDEGHRSDRNV